MLIETIRLANIAATMGLNPIEATYLPACIDVIASKMTMSRESVIRQMNTNADLRAYVKSAIIASI